jgi:hypothetical protein
VDADQTNLVFAAYGFPTSYLHNISSSHSAGTSANNTLKFGLSNTSGVTNTVMTLVGTGNVGIGTTSPVTKLQLKGSAGAGVMTPLLTLTDSGGGVNNGAGIDFSYASSNLINARIFGASVSGGGGSLNFATAASDGATPATAMTISKGGNVGIGTTTPSYPLQINTSAYYGLLIQNSGNSYGGYAEMSNSGGVAWGGKNTSTGANGGLGYAGYGVWCGAGTCGGASGWTNFSDRRLKRDIQSIENPLEKILRLDGVTYHWREAKRDAREGQKLGLIAQDVEKVFPQAVKTDTLSKDALPGGTKMITYTDLVAPIIAAIKEFHQKWFADSAELHAQLEQVKSENAAMKTYLCQKDPSAPFCH